MKVTILVDNYVDSQKLKAEHGLSVLIEADNEKILFDCGQSDLILNNAKILGIDLKSITRIVLSHGHYDHTGGFLPLLKYLNREVEVHAHPLIFEKKFHQYKGFNDFITNRYIGIPETAQTYERNGAKFLLSKESVRISDNIYFSGQIDKEGKDNLEDSLLIKEHDVFIKDPLYDDISMFVTLPGLLVVVTGCAHSGIINILNKAKDLRLDGRSLVIIGGLHLAAKNDAYMDNVIKEFQKYNIKLLVPGHCSGINSFVKLKNSFGDKCAFGSIREVVEFL